MSKISRDLYKATRSLGKVASTVNTLEHLGKSVKTGDPSHIAKHVARKTASKATYKGANEITKTINKLFK